MKRWAFGILAAVALASSSGAFAHFVYPGPAVHTVTVEATPALTLNERSECRYLRARTIDPLVLMTRAQTEASAEYWARLARYCP